MAASEREMCEGILFSAVARAVQGMYRERANVLARKTAICSRVTASEGQ
jgi:hypothetical protein